MNPLGVHARIFVDGWSEPQSERAIAAAARHGFEVIEIPLLDPARINVRDTRRQLERAGLRAVTSLALDASSDISSGDPEPVARGEAKLAQALSVARDLGSALLTGVFHSALDRHLAPPSEAGRWNAIRVLRRLAERAAKARVTLGLEPVNRYQSNLVNTAAQALDLIEQIDADNMVVHLDTHHMNLEEGDPGSAIERCAGRLGYVHAGESHRGYLGTGTVDFGAVFAALAKIGYGGPITVEAYSAARGDPARNAALSIWRELWSDADDLARHAHQFMAAECGAARHRVA